MTTPRFVELSHIIRDGLITYPGLPAPSIGVHLSREASRTRYAPGTEFEIGHISMVGNTGTYLDTPYHRYADGYGLDELQLERVAGVRGVVVDAPGPAIGAAEFAGLELRGRALLIRSGWSRRFGTGAYGDPDHPYLAVEAVEVLVAAAPAVVGIDSVNIDSTAIGERPAHGGLLAAGIPIVEHLTALDTLPVEGFTFFSVPLRIAGMGTFAVRAFAMLDEGLHGGRERVIGSRGAS
jgi:kynurenine formamidase